MPQAIAETVFDIFYLGFAVIAGFTMLIKGKTPLVRKAGVMAALLGVGDSFHLIPRSYGLWTTGLEANAAIRARDSPHIIPVRHFRSFI